MTNQNRSRRYTKDEINTVVHGIISGRLWLEEAMAMFDIRSKQTVRNWLIKHLEQSQSQNLQNTEG